MNELLVGIGVTLIVIDFVVASEVPSILAYLFLSIVVVRIIDVSLLYSIAAGVAVYGLMLVFHFQVLRALSLIVVDKFISPTKVPSGDDALRGHTGIISEISGKRFVRIGDQLCQFIDDSNLPCDCTVRVIRLDEGKLVVEVSND